MPPLDASAPTPSRFTDVLARLAQTRLRCIVVGGVAVVLHGHARPIEDLDLVVDVTQAPLAMQLFAACGFVASLPLPLSAVTVLRLYDARGREIDAFARYPVPWVELERDAVDAQVDGVPLRIASLEHLIRAKRSLARVHDLADVERLEALAQREQRDASEEPRR